MVDFNKLNRHKEIMRKVEVLDVETRHDFEERAGIREFMGGQSRVDSEIGAWDDLVRSGQIEKSG